MRLNNNQLEALRNVYVETGEDDTKSTNKGEVAILFKLDPRGDTVKGVSFPRRACGAIVVYERSGKFDGELYDSRTNLKKAWDSINAKMDYIYAPWKQHPNLGMKEKR